MRGRHTTQFFKDVGRKQKIIRICISICSSFLKFYPVPVYNDLRYYFMYIIDVYSYYIHVIYMHLYYAYAISSYILFIIYITKMHVPKHFTQRDT